MDKQTTDRKMILELAGYKFFIYSGTCHAWRLAGVVGLFVCKIEKESIETAWQHYNTAT